MEDSPMQICGQTSEFSRGKEFKVNIFCNVIEKILRVFNGILGM